LQYPGKYSYEIPFVTSVYLDDHVMNLLYEHRQANAMSPVF
jgi:hypothetical protein